MSGFDNENFVHEFAYRTKLNYYYQRRQFAKDKDEINRIENEIKKIKESMKEQKFDIADYYEVTDLINSLIGLLVFPEQYAFDILPKEEKDLKEKFPKLYKSKSDDTEYQNTYSVKKTGDAEINSPQDIIRHMRNAVSHNEIRIKPNSGTVSGRYQIVSISFEDYLPKDKKKKEKYPHFYFTIQIKDLEDVLMEICNFLINVKG